MRQEAQGDGPGGRPPAGVVPLATAGRRRGAPRPCSCPSAPPGPAARAHSQPFEINRAKTENATGCTTNQEEPDCARPSAAPAARRPAGRSQPPGSAGVQQASSEGQLALLGPAGDRLGRDMEDVGHLGGTEVARSLDPGAGLALCHRASLSRVRAFGSRRRSARIWTGCTSDHDSADVRRRRLCRSPCRLQNEQGDYRDRPKQPP